MSDSVNDEKDLALQPPPVITDPGDKYAPENRVWQGIPGIERSPGGRLWAVWYSGGESEGPDNYVQVVTSDDDGESWSRPVVVVDPPGKARAYDPVLWIDPLNRLWLFWAQSYEWFDGRCGVWAIHTGDLENASPQWSAPVRICNGIAMNRPTVLTTGEWLLPAAVWNREPMLPEMDAERKSNVICSTDEGKTWSLRGGADVPDRYFDEHMVVELKDGRLWMLVRTHNEAGGIGESFSSDRGFTWTPGGPSKLTGPNSRFHIKRLRSGRLLLINHYGFTKRSHMTALLSDDEGETWPHKLLLDERSSVSYPDAVETEDGRIYAIYDRDRFGDREILMAVFREDDIISGKCVSPEARMKCVIDRKP